jgi:hypothetical protein
MPPSLPPLNPGAASATFATILPWRISAQKRSRGISPRAAPAASGVRLYVPRPLEDDLLAGPVAEFCDRMLRAGTIVDWFFIRYADPDNHVRLRFKGDPSRLTGQLLPQLCTWAAGLIASVVQPLLPRHV